MLEVHDVDDKQASRSLGMNTDASLPACLKMEPIYVLQVKTPNPNPKPKPTQHNVVKTSNTTTDTDTDSAQTRVHVLPQW